MQQSRKGVKQWHTQVSFTHSQLWLYQWQVCLGAVSPGQCEKESEHLFDMFTACFSLWITAVSCRLSFLSLSAFCLVDQGSWRPLHRSPPPLFRPVEESISLWPEPDRLESIHPSRVAVLQLVVLLVVLTPLQAEGVCWTLTCVIPLYVLCHLQTFIILDHIRTM